LKNKFDPNNLAKAVLKGTFVKRKPTFGGNSYSPESRGSKHHVHVLTESSREGKKNFGPLWLRSRRVSLYTDD